MGDGLQEGRLLLLLRGVDLEDLFLGLKGSDLGHPLLELEGQPADGKTDRQHQKESQEIGAIADVEREAGIGEKEIKGKDRNEGQDGGIKESVREDRHAGDPQNVDDREVQGVHLEAIEPKTQPRADAESGKADRGVPDDPEPSRPSGIVFGADPQADHGISLSREGRKRKSRHT